jgi:hypothetical protein
VSYHAYANAAGDYVWAWIAEPYIMPAVENITAAIVSNTSDKTLNNTWKVCLVLLLHAHLLLRYVAECLEEQDIQIRVVPPPMVAANLSAGENLDGYLSPDPFNQRAGKGRLYPPANQRYLGRSSCCASVQSAPHRKPKYLRRPVPPLLTPLNTHLAEYRKEIAAYCPSQLPEST